MGFKQYILAAAVGVAVGGANASSVTTHLGAISVGIPKSFSGLVKPGEPFTDAFAFSLPDNGGSGYEVSDFTLLQPDYITSLTSIALYSDLDGTPFTPDDVLLETSIAPGGTSLEMTVPATPAGDYYLAVMGIPQGELGGIYTGAISVSAVPEPETYALMLAGLGAVGFVARRRSSQA